MKGLNTNNPTSQAINGALKLLTVGAITPVGLLAPNSIQMLNRLFGKKHKKASTYLSSMKYQKLVTVEETKAGLIVRATDKGKKRALFASIDEVIIKSPLSWDGKWQMVMFDIPESKRAERKSLAEKLSQLNFLMIQKSCWIYPFPCRNEVGLFVEALGLEKYVSMLTVLDTNFHEFAKRYFTKIGLLKL